MTAKRNHNRSSSFLTVGGCFLTLLLCGNHHVNALTKKASSQQQQQQQPDSAALTLPRRERHLDFMDAATLAYYLGLDPFTGDRLTTPGPPSDATHDVAVMFYAQWDRNSHTLAPIWDQIGQITQAGSARSGLLLGLFDCELDQQHLMLCHAAGITHYPTLMFMSPSRTFPHRPGFPKKKHPALPHTTQFQGIWQYDKSILDWLRTMQRMAGWSRFWNKDPKKSNKSGRNNGGWWQAANYDPETANALPVGVPVTGGTPPTVGAPTASGKNTTTGTEGGTVAQLTAALKEAQTEKEQYEDLIIRSSVLLDSTLFPVESSSSDHNNNNNNNKEAPTTDVFAYLARHQGWDVAVDNNDNKNEKVELQIIKACAMEISLDYCTRVTTHQTTDLVRARSGQGATLEELEAELTAMIATAEPYCESLDTCIQNDFKGTECRSPVCPFANPAACSYLSACFDPTVQADYAQAMGLALPTSSTKSGSVVGM